MSLCDVCPLPGYCCREIKFFADWQQVTFWLDEPVVPQLAARMSSKDREAGRPVPFRYAKATDRYIDEASGRPYGSCTFTCVNLTPAGRCGDHVNRPWLCRVFEPGFDSPCVLTTTEAGDFTGDELVDHCNVKLDPAQEESCPAT